MAVLDGSMWWRDDSRINLFAMPQGQKSNKAEGNLSMSVPTTEIVEDIKDDIVKVKQLEDDLDGMETRIGLLRLEEILKSWRVNVIKESKR